MQSAPPRRLWCALVVAGALSVHACNHDWDKYDPLLGGATTGASSGTGGSTSTSTTSSGGGAACTTDGPVESCATPCDGGTPDHCGVWSEAFSGNGAQEGYAVAVTPDAGVVAFAGFDQGNTYFAGKQLNTTNAGKTWVVAFDQTAAGPTFLWGYEFDNGTAASMAFDPSGDLLVAGHFSSSSLMPCPAQAALTGKSARSMFAVKYDPLGNCRFARSFGDGDDDSLGLAVAADATGVYLGGSFRGIVDFGDNVPVALPHDAAAVLVKLVDNGSPTPTTAWKVIFDGSFSDQVSAVAVEPQGDVIVGGDYSTPITFGGNKLGTGGFSSALVARLAAADGTVKWSRGFTTAAMATTAGETLITSVAIEPSSGDVLVAGTFAGTAGFSECGILEAKTAGTDDVFVLRLAAADGACLWARSFARNVPSTVLTPRIATYGAGCLAGAGSACVVVSATIEGSIDVGSWPLVADDQDVLLFTLDSTGAPLWARVFGGPDQQDLGGLAVDASGGIYLTGSYLGGIAFSPTEALVVTVDTPNPDAFLARIAAP